MSPAFARLFVHNFVLFSLLSICSSIGVTLNMASNYSFLQNIVKAQVATLESVEYAFVLFTNGTIVKFDNVLAYVSTISCMDGQLIADFQLCVGSFAPTPTIMVTLQSKSHWKLINLVDPTIQYSFTTFPGTVKVFCIGSSLPSLALAAFSGTVYYKDMIQGIKMVAGGIMSTTFTLNFTCSTDSAPQNIKKVLKAVYSGKTYEISVTQKGDRLVTYDPAFKTTVNLYQSLVEPSGLKKFFIDAESIFFLQSANGTIDVERFLNLSALVLFNTAFRSNGIKGIRPKYAADGDRVFFYNDKMQLSNLASNTYNWKSTLQTVSFANDTEMGFVVFSSGINGFAFQVDTPRIYSYCQSLTGTCSKTAKLPVQRSVSYCFQYNMATKVCSQCEPNFYLVNNTCQLIVYNCSMSQCSSCLVGGMCLSCTDFYDTLNNSTNICDPAPITNCIVSNCTSCYINTTCLACTATFYELNTTTNKCDQVPITNCSVANCTSCYFDTTCLACTKTYYKLNTTANKCEQIPITNCTVPQCTSCYFDQKCLACTANYYSLNSTTNNCDPLPITNCSVNYCKSCYVNTTCLTCAAFYQLNSNANSCDPIQTNNCSVGYCTLCYANGTCLECDRSHQLNSTHNQCDFIPVPCCAYCTSCLVNGTCLACENTYTLNTATNSCDNPAKLQQSPTTTWPVFNKQTINQRISSLDPSVLAMTKSSSKLNSSPLIRTFLGFLSPLFGMFDDYWFYIYHQNTWDNLYIFPDLLVIMYVVNQERLVPDYLRFTDSISIQCFTTSEYFKNYTSERIIDVDDQMVYTAQNFQDILLKQFPFLILQLLFVKLVILLIYKNCLKSKIQNYPEIKSLKTCQTSKTSKKSHLNHHSQTQILKSTKSSKFIKPTKSKVFWASLNSFFEDMLAFKSIILTFLGPNIIYVSFQLSSQFKSFFSFDFIDSINMFLTAFFGLTFVLSFVILISISESLYPSIEIEKTDKKKLLKAKKQEIQRVKYEDMNTVLFQGIKCILYGFIHGYFIDWNALQYILLMLTKVFVMVMITKNTRLFEHSPLLISNFMYYFVGFLIDCLSFFSKMNLIPRLMRKVLVSGLSLINIIQLTLICVLVGSVLIGMVLELSYVIKESLCSKRGKEDQNLNVKKDNILSLINKVTPFMEESVQSKRSSDTFDVEISNYQMTNFKKNWLAKRFSSRVSSRLSKISAVQVAQAAQAAQFSDSKNKKVVKFSRFAEKQRQHAGIKNFLAPPEKNQSPILSEKGGQRRPSMNPSNIKSENLYNFKKIKHNLNVKKERRNAGMNFRLSVLNVTPILQSPNNNSSKNDSGSENEQEKEIS